MILCNYVSYGTNACESKLKHYFSSFQMDWFTSKLKKSPISYQSASSQPNKTKLPKLVFDCGKIPQARTQEPTRTVWNRNVLLLVHRCYFSSCPNFKKKSCWETHFIRECCRGMFWGFLVKHLNYTPVDVACSAQPNQPPCG